MQHIDRVNMPNHSITISLLCTLVFHYECQDMAYSLQQKLIIRAMTLSVWLKVIHIFTV